MKYRSVRNGNLLLCVECRGRDPEVWLRTCGSLHMHEFALRTPYQLAVNQSIFRSSQFACRVTFGMAFRGFLQNIGDPGIARLIILEVFEKEYQ
jgi:hypothetical protein